MGEVEFAECDCCGLREECTVAYIAGVRNKFGGRWICGLCSEAVKVERVRSSSSTKEALGRHMKFCEQFKFWSPPVNTAEDLISAMKHLLRRSLDSPRNTSNSASKTCFSSLSNAQLKSEPGLK